MSAPVKKTMINVDDSPVDNGWNITKIISIKIKKGRIFLKKINCKA